MSEIHYEFKPCGEPAHETGERSPGSRWLGWLEVCLPALCWFTGLVLVPVAGGQEVRIATFNASLYRNGAGELQQELATQDSAAARKVAEILQIVRPDIILLNEFDYDPEGLAVKRFQQNYLEVAQGNREPITYAYQFAPPVNTGVPSGLDLDRDGKQDGPGDAWGYGKFPGQYGFVVLSKYPINEKASRTFQEFPWKDMPDAQWPRDGQGKHYYPDEVRQVFRLSSKNHCDVVIDIEGEPLHFLVSHPTPPVFDGDEDRNGRRNHDEIRFWNDYVTPGQGAYIHDDRGQSGGLAKDAQFVIAGDLNADPHDGDSTDNPLGLLAGNSLINFKIRPTSEGAVEAAKTGAANQRHRGDPALDTADFNDASVGNLRVDYVLPSVNLKFCAAKVFWPKKDEPESKLIDASDHRLVWIDVMLK